MSFVSEWILAVHRAIWFPVLWSVGLEADGAEVEWPGAPEAADVTRVRSMVVEEGDPVRLIRGRAA